MCFKSLYNWKSVFFMFYITHKENQANIYRKKGHEWKYFLYECINISKKNMHEKMNKIEWIYTNIILELESKKLKQ